MGLRINTNISSLNAQRNVANTTLRLGRSLERLSSGLRINRAADDAAGLALSEIFRSEIRSIQQAQRNTLDAVSLVQVAEGALDETGSILIRMRELAVQSANGTFASGERALIDQEFQDLISEISRIANVTSFNGINILTSSGTSITFQVGVDATSNDVLTVSGVAATAGAIGVSALNVLTAADAQSSLAVIDSAIAQVASLRATFGTTQNRLESTARSLAIALENTSAAESRIRDVDVAQETANLTRNQVLQQAGIAILAQANLEPVAALTLLQ